MPVQLMGIHRDVTVELNERGKAQTGVSSPLALLGIAGEPGDPTGGGWTTATGGPRYLVLGAGPSQPMFVGPAEVAEISVVNEVVGPNEFESALNGLPTLRRRTAPLTNGEERQNGRRVPDY